jgi:hypothetical protein
MFFNAIIFAKLEHLYRQITTRADEYFLTFAPVSTCFSNNDFGFLDPNAKSGDALRQNAENKMAFAQIANAIIRNDKLFELNNEPHLQVAYQKILDDALLVDSTVSAGDKAAYENAKALLFINDELEATPAYTKYKELAAKVSALDKQVYDINTQLSEGDAAKEAALLQQKQQVELQQNMALNELIINGDKDRIDNALKLVFGLNKRAAYKSEFNNERGNLANTIIKESTVNSNIEYLPVFCLPNQLYKYDFNGWKKITIEKAELGTLEQKAKALLGEDLYNAASDPGPATITKLEFEYLFVTIQRNWFKKDLVNSRFWDFGPAETAVVSNGTDLSTGILPAFADKFIFTRRVMQYVEAGAEDEVPEVQTAMPAAVKFSEIARLKNFAKVKELQPAPIHLSKVRMAQPKATAAGERKNFFTRQAAKKMDMKHITGMRAKPKLAAARPKFFLNTTLLGNLHTAGPAKPTSFNISLAFTDATGNAINSLDVDITNTTTGMELSAETGNTGQLVLKSLPAGNYHLQILNNELFEDFENTYNIGADLDAKIVLQRRPNPKFDMWLLGAINYRFPKLPNPIEQYIYS